MWLALVVGAWGAEGTWSFAEDAAPWTGGTIDGGVLAWDDGEVALALGDLVALSGTLRLRLVEGERLALGVGEASWTAGFEDDGGITLGDEAIPFPHEHRRWEPDAEPALDPGASSWEAGGILHTDVHRDEETGRLTLFWTGQMAPGYGYRQIGFATSDDDGATWTRNPANPVLTIDYDLFAVDGVHVHMPSVVVDGDGTWHLFYACYQNDVGNRICHATSADGASFTPLPEGAGLVALDLGETGAFDSGSLRMPEVVLDDDGTWHMLYNGTDPAQHYGPTGYATSADGTTWTKQGQVSADETRLQGGGILVGPYGAEQWWNCADVFCYSRSPRDAEGRVDWTAWEDGPGPDGDGVILRKAWASWSDGYIQAPTVAILGTTYHMWFNGYSYTTGVERLGHARTVPVPGGWLELALDWDGERLAVTLGDGPTLETPLGSASGLTIAAEGRAELDEAVLGWEVRAASDTADTGEDGDTGEEETDHPDPSDGGEGTEAVRGGCGCAGAAGGGNAVLPWILPLLAGSRRIRSYEGQA